MMGVGCEGARWRRAGGGEGGVSICISADRRKHMSSYRVLLSTFCCKVTSKVKAIQNANFTFYTLSVTHRNDKYPMINFHQSRGFHTS